MKFKLNQKVYCKKFKQYGKIIDENNNNNYHIVVNFGVAIRTYTKDGRHLIDEPISLIIPLKDQINKLLSLF